jgi:mono/diheme cytochrome c family protein
MRLAVAVLAGASALLVAGCGSQGVVLPTANGVSGTLPKQQTTPVLAKGNPAAGKKLFASEGCSGCHTYGPAGSHATIGPDLDKLAQYAKQANMGSLAQFTQESITTPGAYIQPGYQNVMPTTFGKLPPKQIADLVAFVTQHQ